MGERRVVREKGRISLGGREFHLAMVAHTAALVELTSSPRRRSFDKFMFLYRQGDLAMNIASGRKPRQVP